ncbi:uncharacterized protein K444DRAFT_367546 [Hyaloscypha bicolor E]|uniref:Uncharacterized protein n=1 Tax=Hyaloscypha bicolor E TaxID=1095630 RepID=A0A2J6TE57_9HELO|nr:uncharacterized protein K444DRAFT_367546 [Hyaloscypha bicolor E]PMD61316.1 hypothetical protein K444DRAFT_367546 [Hyaloscypha bicolor E]
MASESILQSRKRASPRQEVNIEQVTIKACPSRPFQVDEISKVQAGRRARLTLLLWHELAPWQQDNEFIISGYR